MRSMLFCPANNPKLYYTAPSYKPDCIIFDLEDAIEVNEKDAARDLLVEGIKTLDFKDIEIFVRINGVTSPFFKADVEAIVPAGVRNIRLPMCQSAEDVQTLCRLLDAVEEEHHIELGSTKIQVGIETPKGVLGVREIVSTCERVIAISFGAEDYTASLGVERTIKGDELLFARSMIANVASMYDLVATDTVWSNFRDEEGFVEEIRRVKGLGFNSKSCIHPSQVELLHKTFAPSKEDVEKAQKILEAVEQAQVEKGGVIAVNGKMVDVPVITKARKIMALRQKE